MKNQLALVLLLILLMVQVETKQNTYFDGSRTLFYPSRSQSFQEIHPLKGNKFSVGYADGSKLEGFVGMEECAVGEVKCELPIGAATNATGIWGNTSGILGLGVRDVGVNNPIPVSMVNKLAETKRSVFSIALNKSGGVLTFGFPTLHYEDEFVFTKFNFIETFTGSGFLPYLVEVDSLSLDHQVVATNLRALVDSGSSCISLPNSAYNGSQNVNVYREFSTSFRANGHVPSVTITIHGQDLTVTREDIVFQGPSYEFACISELDTRTGRLGKPMMQCAPGSAMNISRRQCINCDDFQEQVRTRTPDELAGLFSSVGGPTCWNNMEAQAKVVHPPGQLVLGAAWLRGFTAVWDLRDLDNGRLGLAAKTKVMATSNHLSVPISMHGLGTIYSVQVCLGSSPIQCLDLLLDTGSPYCIAFSGELSRWPEDYIPLKLAVAIVSSVASLLFLGSLLVCLWTSLRNNQTVSCDDPEIAPLDQVFADCSNHVNQSRRLSLQLIVKKDTTAAMAQEINILGVGEVFPGGACSRVSGPPTHHPPPVPTI